MNTPKTKDMSKTIFSILIMFYIANGIAQEVKHISGLVTHLEKPISNANVLIKGTSDGVLTDKSGRFSIKAKANDILVFSYLGMRTVEIVIDLNTTELKIALLPKVEELDEVTVKKKRPFTQKELLVDYPTNKRLIKTSRGIVDRDRSSFSMRIVDGANLIPIGTDFLYSLQNLVPNLIVDRKKPLDVIVSLGTGKIIFDVDGFVHESPPTFLSANEIDRIGVLSSRSVGAISKYGPRGAEGVIIINTKSKTWMDDISINRTYDNSYLRDSLIQVIGKKEIYTPIIPDYINELDTAASERKVLEMFEELDKRHGDSPYYLLEVSDYFKRKWKNKKKSGELLDLLGIRFSHDAIALKALAFKYEELGQSEKALQTYLKILTVKSRDAQSHRDVANAYAETGDFQKALKVYARYEHAVTELDTIAFEPYGTDVLLTTELSNIIRLKGKQLSLDNTTIDDVLDNPSTRLLFEWNQIDAEFEIQIVTPEGSYDGWDNTSDTENTTVAKEKSKGYFSKQFFLDDDLKGAWQIYLNYLGNQTKNPTYFKVTVFFDYGKVEQWKELNVYKLSWQNSNRQLFTVNTELNNISN